MLAQPCPRCESGSGAQSVVQRRDDGLDQDGEQLFCAVLVIVKANKDSEAGIMPSPRGSSRGDGRNFNRALIDARNPARRRRAQAKQPGCARRLLRGGPQRATGSVRKRRRTRRRLMDLERQGSRRGDRLGRALPQPDVRPLDHRDPRMFEMEDFA